MVGPGGVLPSSVSGKVKCPAGSGLRSSGAAKGDRSTPMTVRVEAGAARSSVLGTR